MIPEADVKLEDENKLQISVNNEEFHNEDDPLSEQNNEIEAG